MKSIYYGFQNIHHISCKYKWLAKPEAKHYMPIHNLVNKIVDISRKFTTGIDELLDSLLLLHTFLSVTKIFLLYFKILLFSFFILIMLFYFLLIFQYFFLSIYSLWDRDYYGIKLANLLDLVCEKMFNLMLGAQKSSSIQVSEVCKERTKFFHQPFINHTLLKTQNVKSISLS